MGCGKNRSEKVLEGVSPPKTLLQTIGLNRLPVPSLTNRQYNGNPISILEQQLIRHLNASKMSIAFQPTANGRSDAEGKIALDLARVHAPYSPPKNSMVDILRFWANTCPNKVAFYLSDGEGDDQTSMTYAELDHAARATAVRILEKHPVACSSTPREALSLWWGFSVACMRAASRYLLIRLAAIEKEPASKGSRRTAKPPRHCRRMTP